MLERKEKEKRRVFISDKGEKKYMMERKEREKRRVLISDKGKGKGKEMRQRRLYIKKKSGVH